MSGPLRLRGPRAREEGSLPGTADRRQGLDVRSASVDFALALEAFSARSGTTAV